MCICVCFKEKPRESERIDIQNEFAFVVGVIINMDVWACVYLSCSLFGLHFSLELKSMESVNLNCFCCINTHSNTVAPTVISGHECGVVEVVFDIWRLSVQDSNGGNSSVVGVDL